MRKSWVGAIGLGTKGKVNRWPLETTRLCEYFGEEKKKKKSGRMFCDE